MIATVIAALALVQAVPTPEAEALGKRLAQSGTLAALLPVIAQKDREELVAEHPELGDAEKAVLRATADDVASAGIDRLMTATGHAYATRLSIDDLRALVVFNESPAAKRWHEATPATIREAMAKMGNLDLKKAIREGFCAKTGKLCK